jgi:2-amino-4-hydroxy-6-hydroxymethyldihydropteridine diphosphokinase
MTQAFVSVGSNIEPAINVRAALRLLVERVEVRAVSTVYRTAPLGRPGQPAYYNCVVEIETDLSPLDLKYKVLHQIEAELGRVRSEDKYAARTIDLDLIVYDDLTLDIDGLTLPAPEIVERPFVAIPLHELAPSLRLSGSGWLLEDIVAALPKGRMEPLDDYTELLRRDVSDEIRRE